MTIYNKNGIEMRAKRKPATPGDEVNLPGAGHVGELCSAEDYFPGWAHAFDGENWVTPETHTLIWECGENWAGARWSSPKVGAKKK